MTREKPKRLYVKLRAQAPVLGPVQSPRDAAEGARRLIGDRAYEVFLAMYLDTRNRVIGYDEFTEGSLSAVSVATNSVVRNALLVGALGIITAHQHPSGHLEPSPDDLTLWERLRRQCELMQIQLLDNLIVTQDGYYSEMEA